MTSSQPIKIFSADALAVRVYACERELSQAAANMVWHHLQAILSQKNKARVLLATGKSQLQFLQSLLSLGGIDWSKITFFHLDEYLGIKAEHPASFRYYLREKVEKIVNPGEFHYLEGDSNEPLQECDRYSKILTSQDIDLCCLGVGENGHLAFNDPTVANFSDTYKVKLVKLDLTNRQQQVNQGNFPSLEAVPQYAFTVTIPTICQAKKIICLAPEKRKAKIIKQIVEGKIEKSCPASILRSTPQATLFLDVESASLLATNKNLQEKSDCTKSSSMS